MINIHKTVSVSVVKGGIDLCHLTLYKFHKIMLLLSVSSVDIYG